MGWDRQPTGGVHSCTVVVDTWLKLLQRSLHAVRALRLTLPPLPELLDSRCEAGEVATQQPSSTARPLESISVRVYSAMSS